jgi:hypothetical protein
VSSPRTTAAAPARPGADVAAIGAVTLVAAVAALFAPGEPSGLAAADALFRASFAALVVLAASQSRRWTWIVVTGVASVAADGVWIVVGLAGLAVALGAAVLDRRNRIIGAVAAGLAVQVLLRLPDAGFAGASALIAVVAVVPLLLSAYQLSAPRIRRTVRLSLVGAGAFVVVAAIGLAVAGVQARTAVNDGIRLSQQGFDAARDGEEAAAVDNLTGASAAFTEANDALTAPWALPSRIVPVLGVQARAVQDVTSEGANLTEVAAAAADETDLDDLQFVDGRLDLDLVAGFEQPLQDGADALQQAADAVDELDSPWLVAPLDSRVASFEDEVDGALPDAELAIDGVRVAPALFGGDGDRRYFIAFTTPAEMRGLGGFMGNWGELSAIDGDPELVQSGRIEDLNFGARLVPAELHGPEDYIERYGHFRPEHYLQDVTFSPDMPSVSEVAADLYSQASGQEIAGVIVIDPYALAALLSFTGPIQLADYPTPLTAENAADILLREQYLTFDTRSDRKDFLDEATRVVFERLTEGDVPGPRQVAEILGPLVDQGRLMVHSFDPEEQALFEEVGLDGAFPERPEGGDFFSIATQNSANNKIDIFLDRDVQYDATFDPDTGRVDATATITLTNRAPAVGLPDVVLSSGDRQLDGTGPPLGTNRMYFSAYSPHLLDRATIDGMPLPMGTGEELGLSVYSAFLSVPPGATATIVLELDGEIEPSEHYQLGVGMQPLVNPDVVGATVQLADGWTFDPDGAASGFTADGSSGATAELVTTEGDQVVGFTAEPD